ncbi:DUF3298 domain-containing protein [Segetibacter sp. 3557_3]|uniref:DUF3298 and DUF4163 domain-containing protein n=1 Tax=Segetibacter sp. 3557_3 TaxID=2547429 RepID=UPI001058F69D|nr:DUF3298 and DUF4163 domain-containing protein [Segetibacter sp. 3557_3]TDH26622.1 DUF3298 domain-containing protein [Segetibacter sp. 3557_3]
MKNLFFLWLIALLTLTNTAISAQSLAGNGTSGSTGVQHASEPTGTTANRSAAQQLYPGSYISRTGDGYWQRLTIKRNPDNGYNVAITYGGAKQGCTFNGNGVYNNGHLEVDLGKVKPELQATMTISVEKEIAKVFTSNFDDRLKLMWFCGGGASLAGDYKREQTQAGTLSWYKMFTGKIDRYPVTMHLHKSGHTYNGYYYYDQQQRPINISGDDSSTKGKLKLIGFGEPENNEEFVLSFSGKQLTGDWKKKENAKPLTFIAEEATAPVRFDYIYTAGVVPLRPKLTLADRPAATYFAAAVWPGGETASDLYLKKMIRKAFDIKNNGNEEIGGLFLSSKRAFFAAYLKDNQNVKDAEIKELPTNYMVDESKTIMVAHAGPGILTLASSSYSYAGGVHGNYGTSYICIDLVNNKQLLLADVINTQGMKALSSLLEKSFRQRYHLKAGESLVQGGLLEKTIKPNQNFYLTSKGLVFNYVPYEIGPYALGEINLFIPVTEIEQYLQPAVKSLL